MCAIIEARTQERMQKMDNKDKISITLGFENSDKEKYYVYALTDSNGIPFYIGKGCGKRMWQHDIETEKELDKQMNEYASIENVEETLKAKHKKISELGENFNHVIIKWGLTQNEALMAESALINLLKISGFDLTNIANGHSSKKEKESQINRTVAMTDNEFFKSCCLEVIDYGDIDEPCLFACINNSFNPVEYNEAESKEDYIIDCARGTWRIDINKAKKAKYLVAVYNSIIYGVAEIDAIREIHDGELKDFPIYPKKARENDLNGKRQYTRKYIVCNKISKESEISKKLLNKIIVNKEKSVFSQNSIRYSKIFG